MEKSINYFCHEHPLLLTKHYDKEIIECYVCGKVVSNSELAYACKRPQCISSHFSRVILHKRCAELPAILWDPSHSKHPLNLIDYRHLHGRIHCCHLCKVTMDSKVGYRCHDCDFDIHVGCTNSGLSLLKERVELQHPSHIHPLTLMRKQAFQFMCDGCGTGQDVDMAYVCNTCEYWVHATCASLPIHLPLERHKHHHHQLSLTFCFPMKHRRFEFKCDVCDKDFNMACWLYFCGDCRYFSHLKCVGSTPNQDDLFTSGRSDAVRFPLADNSRLLVAQFVMREIGKVHDVKSMRLTAKMLEIAASYSYLFNNPWCLDSKDDKGKALANEDEDEELKICEACVTPIYSSPYYKSPSWKYYIHLICLLLPKTLSSSSSSTSQYGECSKKNDKNHTFTLYTSFEESDEDPSLHRCDLCEYSTNGMVYKCEKCGKNIDVKCAYSPTTIQHESHPHSYLNLTTLPEDGIECRCCGAKVGGPFGYICSKDGCEFALDLRCAQLPATVRKPEWDHHPLLLKFNASADHPSDFFCEVCEEEMHPKKPMYHCQKCDQSYHFDCLATESGRYRNVIFGREVKLDSIHAHPLTYNYITLMKRCDVCDQIVCGNLGFECVSCYVVVCLTCGVLKIR